MDTKEAYQPAQSMSGEASQAQLRRSNEDNSELSCRARSKVVHTLYGVKVSCKKSNPNATLRLLSFLVIFFSLFLSYTTVYT